MPTQSVVGENDTKSPFAEMPEQLPEPALVLRRANASRKGGQWQDEDYDVFDGDRCVGRIYPVDSFGGNETWFWGVSFQLTNRKSYGAFKVEYLAWKGTEKRVTD